MNPETKTCQNCKQNFTIEPEDFDFYKKINVPPPTFCPECRLQRRMCWRNERTFYKGKCAATGKDFLTMFSPEAKMTVYDRDYWWSDKWDQLATGREYDFNKPFFVQYAELLRAAPLPNLANSNCVNSEWGNHSLDMKDSYLFHASAVSENVAYVTGAVETKDSLDIYKILKGVQCYEIVLCGNVNQVFFSYNSDQSIESAFLFDSDNMQQSLGCVNINNRSYCIFNQQYSKEEYKKQRSRYDFGSYEQLESFKKKFAAFNQQYPRPYATIIQCSGVTGSHILNSKNAKSCFDGYGDIEDSKYLYHAFSIKDSYDGYGVGRSSSFVYEAVDTGAESFKVFASVFGHNDQSTQYTYACHGSSNLFGCVGLRGQKYCILNKQYTKEEYEKLVPRIMQHMIDMPYVDAKKRTYAYGEFFPAELSPFAYNETIAQEYFPLQKDNAQAQGYKWHEPEARHYAINVKAAALSDHIKDVDETILKQVIECAHQGKCNQQCTTAFKIIPSELQFLKHHNIALPRLCPNCRHYERLAQRTPFKLWGRSCECGGAKASKGNYVNEAPHQHGASACTTTFKTPYSPDRPEIVYCESCYNAEVV